MLTKAGALYELCEFEHSLKFFTRAHFIASDSQIAKDGMLKCKKTILNRFDDEKVFVFQGGKQFIDFLRNKGDGGTEAYLSSKDARMAFKCGTDVVGIKTTTDQQRPKKTKRGKQTTKSKAKGAQNRMKEDRNFLQSIQAKIGSTPILEDNSVR